jgi:hypothetical protein
VDSEPPKGGERERERERERGREREKRGREGEREREREREREERTERTKTTPPKPRAWLEHALPAVPTAAGRPAAAGGTRLRGCACLLGRFPRPLPVL